MVTVEPREGINKELEVTCDTRPQWTCGGTGETVKWSDCKTERVG